MSIRDEMARDWEAAYVADIPVVDFLLAAGWVKPSDPAIEWGVAAKWGPRPSNSKEAAVDYVEWSRKDYPGDGARLIKRVAASQPGPWEDAE